MHKWEKFVELEKPVVHKYGSRLFIDHGGRMALADWTGFYPQDCKRGTMWVNKALILHHGLTSNLHGAGINVGVPVIRDDTEEDETVVIGLTAAFRLLRALGMKMKVKVHDIGNDTHLVMTPKNPDSNAWNLLKRVQVTMEAKA